ncbi:MAG: LysR family transcriptional regulator [Pseudomonadota bacterium]
MDIKALKTLVTIAEHGSFLAASRALGLSPAAISLHIKTLEEELGDLLFDRSVRPPILTEKGRRTLSGARRVLEAWEQLGQQEPAEIGGLLELGAVPTAIAGLLAGALADLRRRRPGLRVRLTTAFSEELEERVTRGTLDAALMMRPSAAPLGLIFVPVLVEPFHVVAPRDEEVRSDAELLGALPYIRFRRHAWIAGLIEAELAARRIKVDPAMEIDSLSGVLALVEAGLGTSILPASQLRSTVSPGIRSVPFGSPPLTRELGVLQRPDHPRAPQLRELLTALQQTAKALAVRSSPRGGKPKRVEDGDGQRQDEQEDQVHADYQAG